MSKNPFNAYDLLNISPDATEDEIKKAFKVKAHEFHPDKFDNAKPANVLFNILVQAKDILLDPTKRLEHDYAHGIKDRPKLKDEEVYLNHAQPTTDWGSLILAGVAGIAVGAALFKRKNKK